MNLPWHQQEDTARSGVPLTGSDDLGMIPWWSVVFAVAAFAGMQYLFHHVLPHNKAEMMPMRVHDIGYNRLVRPLTEENEVGTDDPLYVCVVINDA